MLLCFFFIFISRPINGDKILSIPFYDFGDSVFVSSEFGKFLSLEVFDLDMSVDYILVSSESFLPNRDDSITFIEKTTKLFQDQVIEVNKYKGDFSLGSKTVKLTNFPFYYHINKTITLEGFPLASKYDHEEASIIHYLYNNELISKRSFCLVVDNNVTDDGTLYFGGIPEKILNNQLNSFSCKNNENIKGWGCDLPFFMINNKSFKNDLEVNFQTNSKIITVPMRYKKIFEENMLKTYIEKNECAEIFSWNVYSYTCSSTVFESFPDVNFVFGGKLIKIRGKDLFIRSGNNRNLMISFEKNQDKKWVFGFFFLKRFISEFDIDLGKVTFYHSDLIPEAPAYEFFGRSPLKSMILYGIGVLVIGCIIEIFVIFNKKNVERLI